MLANSPRVRTAKSDSLTLCRLGVEDLEERLTLSVVSLPNEPSGHPVAVFVVNPPAPSPNNNSVVIAPTDPPAVASPPSNSNPPSLGGGAPSNASSNSTNNPGPNDKQLPPQFSIFPIQTQITGVAPPSIFSIQTPTTIVASPSITSGGILVATGLGGRFAPGEQTTTLGTPSSGFLATAFIAGQDTTESAFLYSPSQNREPVQSLQTPSAGTVIDAGSIGKFASMEDAVVHAAPWVTVLAPTGLGVRSVDDQRLFAEPVIPELPVALPPGSLRGAPEPGTDPLGLGFGPLRSLAPETWVKVEAALPDLDMLKDLAEGDRSSAVWQPGMWLVAAATLWAVFPRRNRTPQRPGSESVGVR